MFPPLMSRDSASHIKNCVRAEKDSAKGTLYIIAWYIVNISLRFQKRDNQVTSGYPFNCQNKLSSSN